MFARIMAVVLTVILLLTAGLSGIGWVTLKNQQTETVMETLRTEAREIAYLAAQRRSSIGFFSGGQAEQQQYIQWKAAEVYDRYGAYILVVDRTGRMMDNMNMAYADNPDFAKTLDREEIMDALRRVLQGEEIELHFIVEGNDLFTVGIPFVKNDMVLGAVFMQTPAQVIEAGASGLLLPVVTVAAAASILAGLVLFLILRGVMKPLARLTDAARAMAEGARRITGADLAVSVTGVAGPDSDDRGNPVGLVFIGLATPEGTFCRRMAPARRTRERIQEMASNHAYDVMRRYLTGLPI
jgi:hypothetical protein